MDSILKVHDDMNELTPQLPGHFSLWKSIWEAFNQL